MDRNKLPLQPRHLEVSSGASKMIFEPMVCLAQTMHISCTDIDTISKRSKWDTTRPMSLSGVSKMNFGPVVRLAQSSTYLVSRLALSPNGQNQASTWATYLGVPSGASKLIYEHMVHLMQIEHLSCTDANTISKLIETRFHMTHFTEVFHRVRLKWFPSLWYVRCKLCTYLVSRLALSPNRPNQASTWASWPRSTIGCVWYF
jgi:hypothetical protein